MGTKQRASIIALDKFIQATRDSGYKGTYSAVAELVDNALQAGARKVHIDVTPDRSGRYPARLAVLDNGCGMDSRTLRQALRFGGSTRFNDRNGLGRYGMGLPNSSLGQARRVEVYTWKRPERVIYSYLDVDEIAASRMTVVPSPTVKKPPVAQGSRISPSGTLVLWSCCDRLSHKRISTIVSKLSQALGRIFRYFIWDGVRILINGRKVHAGDPTFLRDSVAGDGVTVFGEPIRYEVAVPSDGTPGPIGEVTVTFTELPVHEWHEMSNLEKRRLGISNGAGVSVVRADREIDYGWFFMGAKRRENYDDWWRCEVRFDPVLDEAFGMTHTKQQIRPQEYLTEILSPDIESMARALNSRVRQAHLHLKAAERCQESEVVANRGERLLQPMPSRVDTQQYEKVMKELARQDRSLREYLTAEVNESLRYRIVHANLKETAFYTFAVKNGHFILVVNPQHPFYRRVYGPLTQYNTQECRELRRALDLLLLAAARAEASTSRKVEREALQENRERWSNILATFLNG